jgi:hypothetical protein
MPQWRNGRNLRMAGAREKALCAISPLRYALSGEPVGTVPPRFRADNPENGSPTGE